MSKKFDRNHEASIQKFRFVVQLAFVMLCIWIGIEFFLFVRYLDSGGHTLFVQRPPGAEAFLPISALMSVYYFFLTGDIHDAHPAGFFIFIAVIFVSFIFGKSFCSWICPVGFLSEMLGEVGQKIMGRRLKVPRWLDYPLRGVKYFLLGFFALAIFTMTAASLHAFLGGNYNRMADIKMYLFFADLSKTAAIVLTILAICSIFFRGFWCRYLCPYGALLGIIGLLSPHKIKRNPDTCTDCGKCAAVCPAFIKVDQVKTVISDECVSCLNCVDVCPIADTLNVQNVITRRKRSKRVMALAIVGLFLCILAVARISGNWDNGVPVEQYLYHYPYIESYGHPTSINQNNP